ncbi:proline iminopeptidase-family hydrolase [Paenibacillus sp. CF384]|uniref:proline iminopeptidase-family hydrolase n=1 Tax=Paenibacillus sp. CF384 TaxID=1884382 RepID=UPI00089CFDB7|nr:proline iminopeptidase-family hydrolase [Paenibacillus sp. CF384]SDW20189.1 proline iminopeptidase [Paenibacillus sp. CF384]
MTTNEGYIEVPGGKVWYVQVGDKGKTPLLVLHGGPGNVHDPLKSALSALADERPVIFYDQLGSGNSDRPEDPSLWHTDRFVEELACIREALHLDDVHVLGHSWGTMLASSYCIERRPIGIRSLILSSPCLSALRWKQDADRLLAQLPEEMQQVIAAHEAEGTTDSEAYGEAIKAYYNRHVCRLDPWPDIMAESRPKGNKEVYLSMWGPSEFCPTGSLKTYDVTAQLHEIHAPTLFLCGRYDEATPEATQYYQSLVPGAKLHVFEESSHMGYLEETEAYLQVVRQFIRETEDEAGNHGH